MDERLKRQLRALIDLAREQAEILRKQNERIAAVTSSMMMMQQQLATLEVIVRKVQADTTGHGASVNGDLDRSQH